MINTCLKNPLTVRVTGRKASAENSSEDQLYRLSAVLFVVREPLQAAVE